MKCPHCNHVSSEKAKFCSECGNKLSSLSTGTAPDKSQDKSQSSSNIPHGPDKEKIDIRPESEVLDYHSASVSPTQPNEEINNSNPKKEKNHGSSVDSPVKAEHSLEQLKSVHGKKDFAADQKCNESVTTESQCVTSPKRNPTSNEQISFSDRLTIHFHAVVSKDLFKPEKNHLMFVRAGSHIGSWDNNLAILNVSRDLGEHGFLVEGKCVCRKTDAVSESIPYKYVVYNPKKNKLHYEYIHNPDSEEITNRCLFVKSHLLTNEGEWHQYDDKICSEPSEPKNILNRVIDYVWSEQKKKIIKGREIAGKVMLGTIFELLRSWNKINLSNFFCQLQQFYEVYGNPFVFEKTNVKWTSLNYGEKDVRRLLKEFMLKRVTPELLKDKKEKNAFIMEPLNAAVIMLYAWNRYSLELDSKALSHLCTALCLPKLPKEEFLSFWTDVTETFSVINNLIPSSADMVEALINRMKRDNMYNWIIVIPLLHLLKGTSKPFQPVFNQINSQLEQSWAPRSQDRRAMLELMKTHEHLVEVDRLLVRSWMYLMTVEELVKYNFFIHAELLESLQLFTMKCLKEISNSTSTSILKILEHIQTDLLNQRYRCLNEDYGIKCIQASCKLLDVICKKVRQTNIPVACMNLVASVSTFAQTTQQQDTFSEKTRELLSDAKETVRRWIGQTFPGRLLNRVYGNVANFTTEIEMWNNIITIDFMSKDFTEQWRETFAQDFKGKYQKEDDLDQILVYCSKIEELRVSKPLLLGSVEKCAFQAITAKCKPFRGGLAGVFWIIVLLQNPSSLQLEVMNRWPDIVLQDFLVDSRIHGSIYHSKSSRS